MFARFLCQAFQSTPYSSRNLHYLDSDGHASPCSFTMVTARMPQNRSFQNTLTDEICPSVPSM